MQSDCKSGFVGWVYTLGSLLVCEAFVGGGGDGCVATVTLDQVGQIKGAKEELNKWNAARVCKKVVRKLIATYCILCNIMESHKGEFWSFLIPTGIHLVIIGDSVRFDIKTSCLEPSVLKAKGMRRSPTDVSQLSHAYFRQSPCCIFTYEFRRRNRV